MVLTVNDLKELEAAARELAPRLHGAGGVVALYGGMGAGKTTLVAALMRALGSADEVTSPTFALVNDYLLPDGAHVYHFDFYRIEKIAEAYDLGYEEYFYSGDLCLVEWPEKIESLLPPEAMRLTIDVLDDNSRRITLTGV